jgi:hypothetical protein
MAKPASSKAAPAAGKIKTAISLSPKSFRRLGAACVFLDSNQSELIESLISTHLSGYRVVNDGAKSAVPVMPITSATESHGLDPSVAISA